MINVGLIGAGRIADLHALGYRGNPDARIYAVCDAAPGRAEERRIEWNADKAYTDCRDLLDDPKVDAVEVLTPYDTHEPVVIAALEAGKHVACQTPLTTSLASADRIVTAAKASNKVFKVTEIYVTYPPLVLAKRLIDEGVIGDPVGMRIKYVCGPSGGWYVPPSTYEQQMRIAATGLGFETFDHGHHEWATAWFLMGEAERVCAWVDSANGVVDDPAVIMWKCRGGKRYGTCDFMFGQDLVVPSKYYSNDEWFEVTGTRGILQVNQGTSEILDRAPVSVYANERWTHYDDVPADWSEGFIGATRNFIAAIQGREQPILTGEQGREVLRFGLAITASAAKRREVYLDELERPFPALYNWRRRWRERKDCIVGRKRSTKTGWFDGTAKYAPQARKLTEDLVKRFDPAAAVGWETAIGLHLTAEGGVPDEKYSVYVKNGRIELRVGELPEQAALMLRMSAGTWAALLLGKKRIEMALVQGKLKYEGNAEEGLRLKSAFKL
ncbi:MAG: hypothetical protein QG656_2026 [Candidatus Hydrogenedentes bacterium]|nr:hypothetical protein [Candidatus Hydrogenedentota bacterium]